MRFMGYLRSCLYDVYGVHQERTFKRFIRFKRSELYGLYEFCKGFIKRVPLGGEHLYEVFGVYEESAFRRFKAFMMRRPL